MILEERLITYLNSLYPELTEVLRQIETEALADEVPIIRKETQNLLRVLLKLHMPKQILEVGTAVGFSAILMSEYGPEDCHVTTIEKYEKRFDAARANFKRAGKEERITFLTGDAADVLKTLQGPFDMIFMDAAKGQYIHFLPEVLRLLAPGGLIVSDNVLRDGEILESRFAVTRRNRTIHARMREYLYTITHNPELDTTILPVGDGVALSVRD